MSSSPYKITHKLFMNQPIEEMTQLFSSDDTTRQDRAHDKSTSQDQGQEQRRSRWGRFQYEKYQGVTLRHPELINALLEESHIQVSADPWGDPLGLQDKTRILLPHTQRIRAKTMALEAISKHSPDLFYNRWLPWIEGAIKESYREAREDLAEGEQFPSDLYQMLRRVSLRVTARTLCVDFKGELLTEIERVLEGIDTAFARIAFGDKRSRFGVFTSSDIKVATQSILELETIVRPLVRARIGGTSEGDDLISRWVNTRALDGRSLKEDQVIEEVKCFLTMAYSSLPKILFGAVCKLASERQSDFRRELRAELNNAVKLITTPPILEEGTPPPITPQNDSALRSLPLHHSTVLEALRLYPPSWISQLTLKGGVFLLGDEFEAEGEGPKLSSPSQVWMSSWALQRDPHIFQRPQRFWPQRWSGHLESQLPKRAFAPFGFMGEPTLSETYCVELAARFLMLWGARYCVVNPPNTIQWELSLCLRPRNRVTWAQRRDLKG